jgi:hypothetical protein
MQAPYAMAPALPHFAPKAKRVIHLLQNGAPSHVDLFDWKPMLKKMHGTQIPDSIAGGKRFSTMTGTQTARPVLGEISNFSRHGQSGATVSDFMPHAAAIADELCFIKSMHTTQVNHAPTITFFMTGSEQAGRPAIGSWLSYGLGSECDDLPACAGLSWGLHASFAACLDRRCCFSALSSFSRSSCARAHANARRRIR